ncbi:ureidoglycolate hydrolase [Spatholobus suberectus]|nr:ureidoglycolate hydrolase [Spatholobus suberectus]
MDATKVVTLKPIEATPSTFKYYGQVVEAFLNFRKYSPQDAQLDLTQGTPRFYIMHLENSPLEFSCITHHASVTQCLGTVGGHVWYLGVAKSSMIDSNETKDNTGKKIVQSSCGHSYVPPDIEDVQVFKVTGSKFLMFNRGTWHAGPLFKGDTMDFYNLELSSTNAIDYTTHYFKKDNGVVFVIDD